MKYENVKSIMLVVLVAVSCVLTWSLWAYKPKYEFIDKKYVHEVSISDQEEPANLIKPTRILFHLNGGHYGTVRDDEIVTIMNELSTWSFYDISEAKIQSNKQIHALSHSDNRVEITYPDLVPFDLYKGVIHIETQNLPDAAFNKIVINLSKESKEEGTIYFIATDEGKVYESHMNQERITTLINMINRNRVRYNAYGAYDLPDGRTKYFPSQETVLNQYQYYSDYIDPEKFRNALFKDPSFVRRDMLANGEQFTDGFSLLNVDYLTNMIFYVNPSQETEQQMSRTLSGNVLKRSINFVNEHGGWTDNYRYFNMSLYEQMTVFRLFMGGYPVFNEQGMTEIRQYWGADEIYQYKRPYFSLDILLDVTKMKLPSGKAALDYLLADPEFKPEMLQDLMIGYKLSKNPDKPKVFVLEPSWYYLYAGSWLRLAPEEIRGGFNGLE